MKIINIELEIYKSTSKIVNTQFRPDSDKKVIVKKKE